MISTAVRAADAAPVDAEGVHFFEQQVKPLLTANCFKCHGGQVKIKGELRLTSRELALKGGDKGPVIAPGHPEQSLLVDAIGYDGELKMPPDGKLKPDQIATLTQWIQRGAPWTPGLDLTPPEVAKAIKDAPPTHSGPPRPEDWKSFWSFQPVKRPALPAVKNAQWVRNPIDAFVLAKLEEKGLHPAPPASKPALLRRAYYDLIGLPPTPAEVDAFVADRSPDAYDKVIDHLLASPQYGEKWGRSWLDLVRYAETNSYERDKAKPNVWRYRDYVIRSFNQDKPYDQFVKEQLAGDEMPGSAYKPDDYIATGFYRLGIWDDEPSDRDQAKFDALDDLVTTTGQVFLGLTVDCCRCHDHKLDAIPQADYYRLLSFFSNITPFHNGGPGDERDIFTNPGGKAAYEKEVAQQREQLNGIQAKLTAIEADFRHAYEGGVAAAPARADLDDLHYRYYRDTWEKLPAFDSIKTEMEGELPLGLIDIGVRDRDTAFGLVFEGTLIVPQDGKYTFYLDSDDGSRLVLDGRQVLAYDGIHVAGRERNVVVELKQGRLPFRLEYFQRQEGFGLALAWAGPGFARKSLSTVVGEQPHAPARAVGRGNRRSRQQLGRLILTEGEPLIGKQKVAEYRSLQQALEQLKKPVKVEQALCVTETGPVAPDTFILLRGNAHAEGDKVQPGFLRVLGGVNPVIPKPAPGATTCGRRTVLANWIASRDNPLTARVMVNRIFQYHFGRGIVRSSSNFGLQGDKPTHPQLLDWLASEFVAQGWRLKPLHRLIMMSNAYRMSSEADPKALAMDPQNDLLWRFDMRRLTAEELRDSILAVNGTLNLEMYGPSVYPPIPKEVMAGQSRPGSGWFTSSPEESSRRSIYIHVKRSLQVPIIEAFDAAELDHSCPVRFVTVQPTQALGMLNGVFMNEEAEKFAQRLRKDAGTDVRKQVALGLKLATCHAPSAADIDRGIALIADLQKKNGASPEQAMKYFCLMTLNLNEFVYLD